MKERKLNRLNGYDYSRNNLYFITSCVKDRICCFGKIGKDRSRPVPTQMILNQYGTIANDQWYWLAKQYPYVILHAFVVMPNHMHGIIEINRHHIVGYDSIVRDGRDSPPAVGTGCDLSLQSAQSIQPPALRDSSQSFQPEIKIKSLSELIGAYKTTTSKQIHLAGFPEFAWQRSFHDHIIRDVESYHNISDYILNNPLKWSEDMFYEK